MKKPSEKKNEYYVMAKSLNIRSGPGTHYTKVGKLIRGDKIIEVDTVGDWVAFGRNGVKVYVSKLYLSDSYPETQAKKPLKRLKQEEKKQEIDYLPSKEDYKRNRLLFFQKAVLANLSDEKLANLLPDDVYDMNIHPIGTATVLEGIEWREKAPLNFSKDFELESLGYIRLGSTPRNVREGNLIYQATVHSYINCSIFFHLEISEIQNVILIVLKNERGHAIFSQRCP